MNIIEASECGKKVKPVNHCRGFMEWEDWVQVYPNDVSFNVNSEWEAEENKIEVTESQLIVAFRKIAQNWMPESLADDVAYELSKELGLKEGGK